MNLSSSNTTSHITKPVGLAGIFNLDEIINYSSSAMIGVLTKESKEVLVQYIQENPNMREYVLSNIQAARKGSYDSYRSLCAIVDPKGTDKMVQSVVTICDQTFAVLSGGQAKDIPFLGKENKIRVFRVNPKLGD